MFCRHSIFWASGLLLNGRTTKQYSATTEIPSRFPPGPSVNGSMTKPAKRIPTVYVTSSKIFGHRTSKSSKFNRWNDQSGKKGALQVDESHSNAFEHCHKRPAPNVYMVHEEERKQLRQRLRIEQQTDRADNFPQDLLLETTIMLLDTEKPKSLRH